MISIWKRSQGPAQFTWRSRSRPPLASALALLGRSSPVYPTSAFAYSLGQIGDYSSILLARTAPTVSTPSLSFLLLEASAMSRSIPARSQSDSLFSAAPPSSPDLLPHLSSRSSRPALSVRLIAFVLACFHFYGLIWVGSYICVLCLRAGPY